MNKRAIIGIILASLGLTGLIYSGIDMFDTHVSRNPLVGISVVAMFLLLTGILLMNNNTTEKV